MDGTGEQLSKTSQTQKVKGQMLFLIYVNQKENKGFHKNKRENRDRGRGTKAGMYINEIEDTETNTQIQSSDLFLKEGRGEKRTTRECGQIMLYACTNVSQ